MALHAAAANGAWSAGATWNQVTNTPTLHASTNITISTSNLFTATFTAPNTTNACTGVLIYINSPGTGGTVTVTLQESTVDTAAARAIAVTSLVASSWVYFRFATPYVFTTTGAGAYRFKIVNAGATGTTSAAADSGGANIAYLATDNRAAVPGATDNVWVVGHNQATAITVTMDGTQTIGSGTDTTGLSRRTIGQAIVINNSGLLNWDIAASATLTCKGNIISAAGGELRIGTVAVPYPSNMVATLNFDENGTGGRAGLEAYLNGKVTLQGVAKTSTSLWKTTYSSGAGTAASPLIVAGSVDWAVGDEIMVCAYSNNAANYDESENRFIITKNSATSYVVSLTSGGVEAALTYTHTAGAYVLNLQRNIIIKSTTTTEGFYLYNENATAGDVNIDWVRFETAGAAAGTSKEGISIAAGGNTSVGACDYSVVYINLRRGFISGSSRVTTTYTGIISCNGNAPAATGAIVLNQASANKTLVDCFAVKNTRVGFEINTAINTTLTRCIAISNNTAGNVTPTVTGGFAFLSTNSVTMVDCESHCNRNMSVTFSQGVTPVTSTNFLSGSKGNNTLDLHIVSSAFVDAAFINSTFSSTTFITNYLNLAQGSQVRFHTLNLTANNHIWYTNAGIARSSGSGLTDTTTKTVGNLAVRLAPEDLTIGFVWEFLIAIKASSAAQIVGFAQKNVAFGSSVCTIELLLPGSTVADATTTLDNTTGAWQVFALAASYTGLVGAFATIRITAKTATGSAYVYFADFYNGTNVLTGLQSWYNGKPTPVMTDLLGDPASVWAILKSTQTTVGTMGYEITTDIDSLQTEVAAVKAYVDTEVAAVLAAVDTEIAAIKAKTDSLTFTAAGQVDANIQSVNDTALVGNGSTIPWGPST